MLSMKSIYSPLAVVFRSSHEQLNPWHRLCGRIIYFLLFLHATWYFNFFIQAGILYQRLTAPVVIIGIFAFAMINLIATTSLEAVRRWSYRVFFVFHLFIAIALMPLLFFHAKPLRIYVVEALGLFVVDIICRQRDTVTGFATISPVPHTKLVQLKIPVPAPKMERFKAAPGQHVYLSIPPESTPAKKASPSIHDLLFNPFTVADVSDTEITLVIRALHGPTTQAISTLANLGKARPPIKIEGPYGIPGRFPNLASTYDRILLVAGGVGATFILPIYRDLRDQMDAEARRTDRLTFLWSVRSAAEASWATGLETEEAESLTNDESVKFYVTGDRMRDRVSAPEDGSVELQDLQDDVDAPIKASGGGARPDLRKIVDEIFRAGKEEKVAVLVCGPDGMARDLRKHVGKWVGKGREAWFHDESFGW
jgi:NAD(P)H-flavin reductase